MKNLIKLTKAISDETRIRILNLLKDRELCVCDIVESLKITQTKASRHLAYLKNCNLIKDRKHAQWVYYSLNNNRKYNFYDTLVNYDFNNIKVLKDDLDNMKKWFINKNLNCD